MIKPLSGPVHPALVHFPVVAFTLLPILDVLILTERTTFYGIALEPLARVALISGLVTAVAAALAGAFDSIRLPNNNVIGSHLQRHLTWVLASLMVFFVALLVRFGLLGTSPALMVPILDLAGFALLCIGAHHGARLAHLHWPFQE